MPNNKSKAPATVKATKVQLRLRLDQKTVLARAAKLRQTSLSNFMLEHAFEAAQQVLAEQVDIVMPHAEWAAFCKALDAPPRQAPALKKLLSEPSVFDGKETPLTSPAPLDGRHDLAAFDCGVPALNEYLRKFALQNQQNQSARTYVATRGKRVVGYYSLAAGSARREETPTRVAKGLAAHPVPIILLARLAVDRSEAGKGVGKGLLKDALLRVAGAADIIGCRAVMVHAKDVTAKAFYLRFGFEPSPTDPFRLFLLLKDIKASLGVLTKKR